MSIFKTKSNKKFGYTPRYYSSDKDGSPYKLEHKFDKYRSTIDSKKGLKNKFESALEDLKTPDKNVNRRLFFIIVILICIFLYIIDFDLSIFFKK